MISFESDYNNGMVPEIIKRLTETNSNKTSGYGCDMFTEEAKAKVRKATGIEDADIFFLVGGTQTNTTVIDSVLQGCEGVITVETGHIAVHESGAIEAFGHKVITLPAVDSKLIAEDLETYMENFLADETHLHMVQPRMVYVSIPTELGMLYSKDELTKLYSTCQKYHLILYIDGARLGYGLMSKSCEYDLPFLACHCDVFYIGGTKIGAMFGEAIVFSNMKAPKYFFTDVKRHGALLAKGRMLGIQFATLFTDNLYFRIARHAIEMAELLKTVFATYDIPMAVDSPTNQQFVILTPEEYKALSEKIAFEIWERKSEHNIVCRFVTSWATTKEDIRGLEEAIKNTFGLYRNGIS